MAADPAPLTADAARAALRAVADPEDAAFALRYFKCGPGEYGEGDRFLGVRAPAMHRLARAYRELPLDEALALLRSEWHEERLLALLVLVERARRADRHERATLRRAYLDNARHVNNWDLVDASAPHLLGPTVRPDDLGPLERLARSRSLWERRIAMLATLHHTRQGDVGPALRVAELLLADRHDLIHKAVGWMLREAGKRDWDAVAAFLRRHYDAVPRTALRYAVERLPAEERRAWLAGPR